jgi:hypothetical protein
VQAFTAQGEHSAIHDVVSGSSPDTQVLRSTQQLYERKAKHTMQRALPRSVHGIVRVLYTSHGNYKYNGRLCCIKLETPLGCINKRSSKK